MAEIYGFAINVEGNAVKGIAAIDQSLNRLNTDASKSTESIFGGFLKANVAMRAFDAGISGMKSVYNLGVQTEQTRIAFDTMLGSAEKGGQMFQSLKQWADVTPFDNDTAYQAGKMLLNYGVSAQEVVPYMNMLGDASGGVKERFDRMIYAFAQVRAMGRLQGQDLRQLIDAGFNPLQTISEKTGESMASLKDKMEKGKISFDMVVGAFKSATSEGGRFFGMMQSQSQTVGGLESTLAGNLQTAAYGIFQRMAPGLKDVLSGSIEVAKSFADWVTPKQSEMLSQQRIEMNALFEVLKNGNVTAEQRAAIISQLNSSYKDYLPNLIKESDTWATISKNIQSADAALDRKIKSNAKIEILGESKGELDSLKKELLEKKIKLEKYKLGEDPYSSLEYLKMGLNVPALLSPFSPNNPFNKAKYLPNEIANLEKEIALAKKGYSDLEKTLGFLQGDTDIEKLRSYFKGNKSANALLNQIEKGDYGNIGLLKRMASGNAEAFQILGGFSGSPIEPFTKSALGTSDMGKAGGGLGEAKQINIRIDKLMEVNAQAYDGEDMKADASKAVEEITRIIKNMSYGQGLM